MMDFEHRFRHVPQVLCVVRIATKTSAMMNYPYPNITVRGARKTVIVDDGRV